MSVLTVGHVLTHCIKRESKNALRRIQVLLGEVMEFKHIPYAACTSQEAQDWHAELPGPLNCEIGQATQVEAPANEKVPLMHEVHMPWPTSLYLPGEQSKHAVEAGGLYLPASHGRHPLPGEVTCEMAGTYVPAGQKLHWLSPVSTLPAKQPKPAVVGIAVGRLVGWRDGFPVGFPDGWRVGLDEGWPVGWLEGLAAG